MDNYEYYKMWNVIGIVGFGYRPELVAEESVKARTINLLHAVRTLLRSRFNFNFCGFIEIILVPLIFINAFVILISLIVG